MQESLDLISRHRLVPSVVIDDARDARPLADSLLAGGLPLVEVTLRTPESLTAIERIIERHDMMVGVGTVTELLRRGHQVRLRLAHGCPVHHHPRAR